MKTIFKYQFPIIDNFGLELPVGYEIIHVGMQNNKPTLWAIVDTDASKFEEWFNIYETGHKVSGKYIGTFFQDEFVWHLFRNRE